MPLQFQLIDEGESRSDLAMRRETKFTFDRVDLDSVRADLLDAVHETLRPAHAGVWLRETYR